MTKTMVAHSSLSSARVARALLVEALVATVAGWLCLAASFNAPLPNAWGFRGFAGLFAIEFGWIGYLIATRRARNPIGWCFLAAAALSGFQVFATEYAALALFTKADLALGREAAWTVDWMWFPSVAVVILPVLLLFPSGVVAARAWRLVFWIGGAAVLAYVALVAINPGPLQTFGVTNPFGVATLRDLLPFADGPGAMGTRQVPLLAVVALFAFATCAAAACVGLVIRVVRSRGAERQQMKWLALSGSAVSVALVFSLAARAKLPEIILIAAFATVPVAIGVAILRYRLYDVDTLINRAVVYGVLTAILAGGFVALQKVVERIFVATTGASSDVTTVLVLFVLATAFAPLKLRLQTTVDRWFKPHDVRAAPPVAVADTLAEIDRAFALRQMGALTDEEFATLKSRILSTPRA